MTRSLTVLALLVFALATAALATAALATPALAQTPARRPPPRGDVSGLEMTLEGPPGVVRGDTARFFVTLHEVLHERDLAPAPHAEVRVSSDLEPGHPLATVSTDATGRALVSFVVDPETTTQTASIVFDARMAAAGGRPGVRRRFEIALEILPRMRVDLVAVGGEGEEGARVRIVGRVIDVVTGLPRAGVRVNIALTSGARREATTSATGAFVTWLPRPTGTQGNVQITASLPDELGANVHATVVTLAPGSDAVASHAVLVRVTPSARVVRDLAPIDVDVEVRDADGAPIAHAAVRRTQDPPPDEHHPRVETDAAGRARFHVRPGEVSGPGDVVDVPLSYLVVAPGMPQETGTATVRVARVPWVVAVAPEGGVLVPHLPSRLFVRVAAPDGTPAPAGTVVDVVAARLGTLHGRTDASGVARVDVTLADAAAGAEDDCGGATALSVETTVAGTTRDRCVVIDPDAPLRVRLATPVVTPGTSLVATVTRSPAAARMPIVVSALAVANGDANGMLEPVARVELAPGAADAHLDLPAGLRGLVLVRARLVAGRDGEEAHGGTALAWVREPTPAATLAVEAENARVGSAGAVQGETREAALLAMRPALADTVVAGLRDEGPLATQLRASDGMLVEARLADATPEDTSAPAVLRGGQLVALPAREDPTHDAVLRDPFRARARFVSGRIALVVRALKKYVDARLPAALDDVSAQTPHGRVLSRELIEAIIGSSETGNEGPRGLGGAPLTMDSLVAIDPQLDFDHLARRLTRARLFHVLVALRKLVHDQGLDLRWAWHGEPAALLRALVGQTDDDYGEPLVTRESLFDAWGRPFQLVPSRNAPSSATAVRVDPLPGWQLVSLGPDGRAGTADDVRDPFARVLTSGSAYAIAVGEDDLLARAQDVALGRARLEALAPLFDVETQAYEDVDSQSDAVELAGIDDVPAPLPPEAPVYERPGVPHVASSALLPLASGNATATLAGDPEGRTLTALAVVTSSRGVVSVARAELVSRATLLSFATMPDRLRVGETVTVPVHFLALAGDPTRHVRVSATGADASLASATLELPAGRGVEVALRVVAHAAGPVRVTIEADGARPLVVRLHADDGGVLRQQVAGAYVARDHQLSVELPSDATEATTELVVVDPSWLAHDPGASSLTTTSPALVAWADTLAGRAPTDDARLALLGASPGQAIPGRLPALDVACALVAWSATSDDSASTLARLTAAPTVATLGGAIDGDDDGTRRDAAVLAALAAGASGTANDAADAVDPVAAHVAALRDTLRSAVALHAGEPAVLARVAAALLLADARDAAGLEMLRRAAAGADGVHGGLVVRDADGAADPAATAALAIAAQQASDEHVRDGAARGLAGLLARALAGTEEQQFWALAAGAYGALGTAASAHVSVTVDGHAHDLALDHGVGRLSLGRATHVSVARPSSPVLARVVARYARPAVARTEAPLRLALDGDDGTFGNLSGLELTVSTEGGHTVRAPIVEVALPAGTHTAELSALTTTAGVASVEPPDARGLVRVHLAPLAPEQHVVLPIAVRWVARGAVRGFAAVAYDAARPTVMTILPERAVVIH